MMKDMKTETDIPMRGTEATRLDNTLRSEVRREFMSQPRKMLLMLVTLFIIIFSVTMMVEFANLSGNLYRWKCLERGEEIYGDAYQSPEDIMWMLNVMFVIVMISAASMAFGGLRTKQKRIFTLTTPVAASTRVGAQFLIYVVGTAVAFIALAAVTDLLRPMVIKLFALSHTTHFTTMLPYLSAHGADVARMISVTIPTALFFSSLISLGVVVWPDLGFVKSFVAVFLAGFLLLAWIIVVDIILDIPESHLWNYIDSLTSLGDVIKLLFYAGTLYNWTAIWLRLKETDVTPH